MAENEIPDLVRTMLAAGFELSNVERKPNFLLMHLVRSDEFGIGNRYLLAYAGQGTISPGDAAALQKVAGREGASLVVVSDTLVKSAAYVVLTKAEFFGKVGGAVSSVLPLEPEYGQQLVTLGFNALPDGLKGKPDDLFETYAHSGVQFLLRGRVIRYGQDRRFEAVPDGLAFGKNTPLMLYDCKAAEERYEFSKITMRQFADYIREFHRRYETYLGRLHAFLAVSSAFQGVDTLRDRSNELYGECGIPLVCLTAKDLAGMVSLFSENIALRTVVDWKDIFTSPVVQFRRVKEAVDARIRDKVVRE